MSITKGSPEGVQGQPLCSGRCYYQHNKGNGILGLAFGVLAVGVATITGIVITACRQIRQVHDWTRAQRRGRARGPEDGAAVVGRGLEVGVVVRRVVVGLGCRRALADNAQIGR